MTSQQIQEIFVNDLGYPLNQLVDLKEISSIYTVVDHCIYPSSDVRFKIVIDSDIGLLEMYSGKESKYTENGSTIIEFKPNNENIPDAFLAFSEIAGFTLVSPMHPSEIYQNGMAV